MRENRLSKCPLKDSKLLKKEKRGSYDYRFDCNEEILIVKWLDNKCVTVGTNYDTVEQTKTVKRWQKEKKQKDLFHSQMFSIAITKTWEGLINMTGW